MEYIKEHWQKVYATKRPNDVSLNYKHNSTMLLKTKLHNQSLLTPFNTTRYFLYCSFKRS
jgi:hypothetical protein